MGIRAGVVRQCTWYGKELDPTPDLDLTLFISAPGKMGIIELTNTLNGNGTLHTTGVLQAAGFDGGEFSCNWSQKPVEFFQAKAAAGLPGPFTLTLIDGTTYRGSLIPEGQITGSTGKGTISINGRGQKLEQV
jgi:hypothetical protein